MWRWEGTREKNNVFLTMSCSVLCHRWRKFTSSNERPPCWTRTHHRSSINTNAVHTQAKKDTSPSQKRIDGMNVSGRHTGHGSRTHSHSPLFLCRGAPLKHKWSTDQDSKNSNSQPHRCVPPSHIDDWLAPRFVRVMPCEAATPHHTVHTHTQNLLLF